MAAKKVIKSSALSLIFLGIFFLACFFYFLFFNGFVFEFQEQGQLFRFDYSYFSDFLSRPGGLSEYMGAFLTQFFINPVAAAFILTSTLILIFVLSGQLLKKYQVQGIVWSLIPVFSLIALQSDYMFGIGHTVDFILLLSYFALWIKTDKKNFRYSLIVLLWPVLYICSGTFSLLAAALCILYEFLFSKASHRYYFAFIIAIAAILIPYLFDHTLYYIPIKEIWLNPSLLSYRKITKETLLLVILFFPVLMVGLKIAGILKIKFPKTAWDLKNVVAGGLILLLFFAGMKSKVYDGQIRIFLEMDHQVQQGNWNKVLQAASRSGGSNRLMLYYTNLALYKTGQLGNKMFNYNQIGLPGLWLSRDGDPISLFLGGGLFYDLGNLNEATRWAYDAGVNNGQYSPRLLKQLILSALINGDYKVAGKYLNLFDKTLFYRQWARHYRNLANNPDLVNSDPDIAEKRHFLIQDDFVAQTNEFNIGLGNLLKNHPDNRMAFEYYMSSLLLSKNLDAFAENIGRIKDFGYKEIPVHYEEALIFYMGFKKKNAVPEGYQIHRETYQRFQDYASAFGSQRQNPSSAAENLAKSFGNTYWFYLHFINNRTSSNETNHPFN